MVLFSGDDAETPLSPSSSLPNSLESTIVPPMPPAATPLNLSLVDNLSLSRLNQANPSNLTTIDNLNRLVHRPPDVSANHTFVFTSTQPFPSTTSESESNPIAPPFSNPFSLFGNTPFQSPRPQPFPNPTDRVLGRNQSELSTHTQTFSNPQQIPGTSVDLEHKLSQLILSRQTHDVQGINQYELFADASYSYGVNGEFPYMQPCSTTGNSSKLIAPSNSHDHQITGKSDQPVIIIDDSDDENTKAVASLEMEKPPVLSSVVTGEQNVRKSMVVQKTTKETALMSDKTAETYLLSEKPAHGTNPLMFVEPEETHSRPATNSLMGSGSVHSSKKQQNNSSKLKLVLPLTRSEKIVDGVQAKEANVSDAKKSALDKEGIEIEQPERKTTNLRSRGAVDKDKNLITNGQESRIQTRSQTGKQVKDAPSKFSLTLTKEEIEADFIAMTGSLPPKKPKRRAKNLQKQLGRKFPGLWLLSSVSAEAYDHSERPLKG